jgi:2-keto-4-pentenoate hydratase/2-oxohepta-3-ene-1,7-dioic acid hydratase in catechol pathway
MKIICIGRNYVEHIEELKNEVPAEPVFFLKPDTAILPAGRAFYLPDFSKEIHHEIELILRISKEGKNIADEFAHRYYDAISVGLDFTARDIQEKQKSKGLPWEPAKAFDHSAPLGEFIPVESLPDKTAISFSLNRNGVLVQAGDSKRMIHRFGALISFVSKYITLRKGDVIFTGTPSGVGPVKGGDELEGFLNGQKLLHVSVK